MSTTVKESPAMYLFSFSKTPSATSKNAPTEPRAFETAASSAGKLMNFLANFSNAMMPAGSAKYVISVHSACSSSAVPSVSEAEGSNGNPYFLERCLQIARLSYTLNPSGKTTAGTLPHG